MKSLYVFATLLALSLAESEHENYEDLLAAESIELQKTDLKPSASVYASVGYPSWSPPPAPYNPPAYNPAPHNPPVNYNPPPTYPVSKPLPPVQPPYVPSPPPSSGPGYFPQNDYIPQSTTTTPVPVIKNEQLWGENGSYKYEYQIADGTWVGEEGWFTGPSHDEQSLVKKGWYQYKGADGKLYTVTWWADKTGYHAFGDHLPTPPPIPPAIQASIEQNAKEEAAKAEAEKNKPQIQKPVYYDPIPATQPIYPPQQPIYPPQQPNYPSQQPNYPAQQPNYPAQQPNYPSQQPNYPAQQPNYPAQQPYYPPQQTYYPSNK